MCATGTLDYSPGVWGVGLHLQGALGPLGAFLGRKEHQGHAAMAQPLARWPSPHLGLLSQDLRTPQGAPQLWGGREEDSTWGLYLAVPRASPRP